MEITGLHDRCPLKGALSMHILVVDDEPNIRRTLRIALEADGHTVDEAGDGAAAVRGPSGGCVTWPSSTSAWGASRGWISSGR